MINRTIHILMNQAKWGKHLPKTFTKTFYEQRKTEKCVF